MNPSAVQPIHKSCNDLELRRFCVAAPGQQTPFTCRLPMTLNDPELRRVIETWDVLSEPVKKAILALVKTADC